MTFIQLYKDYYCSEDDQVYIATSFGFECLNISFDEFIENELKSDFEDPNVLLAKYVKRKVDSALNVVSRRKFNVVVGSEVEAQVLDVLLSLYPRGADRNVLFSTIKAELLLRGVRDQSLVEKIFMKYIQHQNIRKAKELFKRKDIRDFVKMVVEQNVGCKVYVSDDGIIYVSRRLEINELKETVKYVKNIVKQYFNVKLHFKIQYNRRIARMIESFE